MKLKTLAASLALLGSTAPVFATNGMNLEGYGPVATAMGGASFAYDNGTAGLINNPATLALMPSGTSRFDIAVGGMHPSVTSKMTGVADANSAGKSYFMPALGYARKDGKIGWGIGMMAQGGMGTEYGTSSFLSSYRSMTGVNLGASGLENRSELGIGRIMAPLTYDVSDNLSIGGTIDYLWGGLDLKMVMDGNMFSKFITPNGTPLGSATGSMISTMGGFMVAGLGACAAPAPACITDVNWAQFDFSEGGNKMKQQAKTSGWAGNIGFVWKVSPVLSIGGVYHAKTSLKDMEGAATLRMNVMMNLPATLPGSGVANQVDVSGKIKVVDFQWPTTYGIGLAYQASDRLMIAADYKWIGWADVMKNFKMTFTADGAQANAVAQQLVTAGGTVMNATLNQGWKNQNVVQIGASYKVSDPLTIRAGASFAGNPIPNDLMNPLFPAVTQNHYTAGFGYRLDKTSSVDFSYAYAPKVTATNNNFGGVSTSLAETHNWQLMYSHRF